MALHTLSLFAGAGGLDLAVSLAIPAARTVCYVEREAYAAAVLAAHMAEGRLHPAPVWSGLATFDGKPWRGRVDLILAGFPCQPFSTASRGRKRAIDAWPECRRVIGEVRPALVFLENVQREPIQRAGNHLSAMGYVSVAMPFDAACVGSASPRLRYWLLAYDNAQEQSAIARNAQVAGLSPFGGACEWSSPDRVLGMDDALANRVDRYGLLGNGVDPLAGAIALDVLLSEIGL